MYKASGQEGKPPGFWFVGCDGSIQYSQEISSLCSDRLDGCLMHDLWTLNMMQITLFAFEMSLSSSHPQLMGHSEWLDLVA